MNEDILKEIVSVFIKRPSETIDKDTAIDSSSIQGSVLFHRMISRINDSYQIEIDNYGEINNYENLCKIIKKKLKENDADRG